MPNSEGISGRTHLIVLLGNPTSHSLSPAIHNLSFDLLGIDAVYLCFDVENEDLETVLGGLRAMTGWDGCNVTMPCKQAVIPYLDGLDPASELIGAVNVIKKDGTRLMGYNTDGRGFMANLAKHDVAVADARVALLGPGGAGSAIIAQAALDGASRIDTFARTGGPSYRHAQGLVERVAARTSCRVELHDLADMDDLHTCIQEADILVNATSVGMGSGCEDTLVPAEHIKSGMVVADAIYHPRETRLIRDARSRGCTVVPGLGMIVEQAAASEEIWFDAHMPVDEITRQLFE